MFIRSQNEYGLLAQQRQLMEIAKIFRKTPTPAEKKLWSYLRSRRLAGLKFRRQHPVFRYIADFYCFELNLIIEVDGGIHDYQIPHDQSRDEYLRERGYTILRFRNDRIDHDISNVLEEIKQMTLS
ncbi:MAG: endonuclease domain-containing protein [Candidatus Kerfeldbacteria bacterium]|nr:endonuclease domain-containing protein [Candidatus Kerfeldbacteria bacterium]